MGIPIKEILERYLGCNIFKGRINKGIFDLTVKSKKRCQWGK